MSDYLFLVPLSLILGVIGLAAFLWSLRHEQYDDLDGAAERVLFADDWPIIEHEAALSDSADSGVNSRTKELSDSADDDVNR